MRSPSVPCSQPAVSGLRQLVHEGALNPRDIIAILGKTEGNGGVNDFTREYASLAFATALAAYLNCSNEEVEARVALVMSGGTEGVLLSHTAPLLRICSTYCADAQSNCPVFSNQWHRIVRLFNGSIPATILGSCCTNAGAGTQ